MIVKVFTIFVAGLCAETNFRSLLGDTFQSASDAVGKGIGFCGNIASNFMDGVETATKRIYHTIFGCKHECETPYATGTTEPVSTSQMPQSPSGEDESNPEATVAESITLATKGVTSKDAVDEVSPVTESNGPTEKTLIQCTALIIILVTLATIFISIIFYFMFICCVSRGQTKWGKSMLKSIKYYKSYSLKG
ncbi:uncharacterized protein LOC129573872 [Sitodiplosis mosellana]|uniref:uncharacterized protein LOC129573872 n=1 Tax=Sitodiplosis mosellana TaxID=263140 RepID=UPI002444E481|nr:uncharacterized protein LOC129573872 [Sitodiplosis mosellana]